MSWRAIFFFNVPFCIAAVVLMLRYVKETRDAHAERHIDVPGMVAITGGLVAISYGIDKGQAWGWTSAATLVTILSGVLLLGLFVLIESRVRAPLIDLDLFRNRAFDVVVLAGSLSNVVFCFVAVFSGLYLQQARGLSPLEAGFIFLALSGGTSLASYYSGRLAEQFPADRLMAIGMLISAVGIVGLTSVTSLWIYTPLFFVCGIGLGLGWALANVATQAVVAPELAGAASGGTLTSLVMFGAVGVAVGATALELISGSASTASSDADAIDWVLRAGAVLAVLGAVALIALGRKRQPELAAETAM